MLLAMGRGKSLSDDVREKIVRGFLAGIKQSEMAKNYVMNRSVVSRVIKRYKDTASSKRLRNTGRPKKTSDRADRKICNLAKVDPFLSSRRIMEELKQNGGIEISARTIRRRLVHAGLFARRPAKKPLLSKKNRRSRLQFARDHLNWTFDMWKRVVFSDESKFNLFKSDGACYVRRPRGERLNKKYVCPTVKHGGGSAMVWGCFSGYGMGPLHRIVGTMDRFMYRDILRDHLLPYTEEIMPLKHIFQHDNDPKHSSRLVKEWLGNEKIAVMQWPSQSPDLNPIENLWEIIDRKIRCRTYSNVSDLFKSLQESWAAIDKVVIKKLLESMPRRCAEVIKVKGYFTKY